jgi:hypothetical protein
MGTQAICLDGLTNPELAYLPGKIFHLADEILYRFRIMLRCGSVLLGSAIALQHATQHGKDRSGNKRNHADNDRNDYRCSVHLTFPVS